MAATTQSIATTTSISTTTTSSTAAAKQIRFFNRSKTTDKIVATIAKSLESNRPESPSPVIGGSFIEPIE